MTTYYKLSFAQRSTLMQIDRAGGVVPRADVKLRVATKLAGMGLVQVTDTEVGLTAEGIGVSANLRAARGEIKLED